MNATGEVRSSTSASPRASLSSGTVGAIYSVLAYAMWGVLPLYWKMFAGISPVEIVAHRMLWSLPFALLLVMARRHLAALARVLRSPRQVALLTGTAALLSVNWGIYIYGVNTGRIVETSLGYFINPLVNVALGFLFLKERFNRWQVVALVLAAAGVANFIWSLGTWPWIALMLAFSFGLYGLARKTVQAGARVGLSVETLAMAPAGVAIVAYGLVTGSGHFGAIGLRDVAFVATGVVTVLPLLWFAEGARRLRLSTLGIIQYLAPSLQFLLGVFLYREPFTTAHAVTFGTIWTALAIYSLSTWRTARRAAALAAGGGDVVQIV
ncbi:MAG: EamA family transporter RarD [Acidobacteriota bacterium]